VVFFDLSEYHNCMATDEKNWDRNALIVLAIILFILFLIAMRGAPPLTHWSQLFNG